MDEAILRIVDANLNRAREALRVLEEHARMVLNDATLAERVKQTRHDLVGALHGIRPEALLAARDVDGDVGTAISVPTEGRREDAGAVALAAAKRAGEALRCLEEYGKILDPGAAGRIEQLRYRVYRLEQDICGAGSRRARLRATRLHVLITESLCHGPWLDACAAAIDGGAGVLQLREKELPDRELVARGRRLRELTAACGVLMAVNDRPDIARLVGADIVHVGQDDLPVGDARRIAGPTVLVGKSTHSVEQVRAALIDEPDYVAVGPMFASSTKQTGPVQGPELLSAALALTDGPIVAIGGITPESLKRLPLRPNVQIAVCQAVIAADDAQAAARTLSDLMDCGVEAS